MNHCPECGYPNDWSAHRCEKCGVRFHSFVPPASRAATAENPLEFPVAPPKPPRTNRARKQGQPSLPFDSPSDAVVTPGNVIRFPEPANFAPPEPAPAFAAAPAPVATWGPPTIGARARSPLPLALQHQIAFPRVNAEPSTLLEFPVAPLQPRAIAALIDGAIIGAGFAAIVAAFFYLGGRIALHPVDRSALVPFVAAAAILPMVYLYLFLVYARQTPGMSCMGLHLVNFDGRPATMRQRRRRVWASAASFASLSLGFFWAAVDDERLTWHDHMSETCLTELQ